MHEIDLFKNNSEIDALIKHSFVATKVKLYFATKSRGDYYDTHEKNYTYTNLAPLTIKAVVRDLKPEALIYKQYGLSEAGMKEIIVSSKYLSMFREAQRIDIDSDQYQVYREGTGNRALITELKMGLAKIVLSKVK